MFIIIIILINVLTIPHKTCKYIFFFFQEIFRKSSGTICIALVNIRNIHAIYFHSSTALRDWDTFVHHIYRTIYNNVSITEHGKQDKKNTQHCLIWHIEGINDINWVLENITYSRLIELMVYDVHIDLISHLYKADSLIVLDKLN